MTGAETAPIIVLSKNVTPALSRGPAIDRADRRDLRGLPIMRSPIRSLLAIGSLVSASLAMAQVDSVIVDSAATVRTFELSDDSLSWRMRHRPTRATLYSAILPGAGQIYNRKYWKAPIVWGGLGLSIYFIQRNTREYERYRNGYVDLVDDDPATVSEFEGSNAQSVRDVADTYHKWRDMSFLAVTAVYILNVVDATVDAHFVRFDVGEDLSMDLVPTPLVAGQAAPGLSLVFALR